MNKIEKLSPDPYIKKHGVEYAANANVAMVNEVVDAVTSVETSVGGTAPTPVVRTNNPIVGTNAVNTNIDVLDASIGADPTSTVFISTDDDVNANLSTLDAVANILNQRDIHTVSVGNIIKHTLMAIATYDFDVDGGATGDIDLNEGLDLFPAGAIIKKVYYDVTTPIDSGASGGTIKFATEEFDLTADLTASAAAIDIYDGVMTGTAATMDKLTAASKIFVTIGTEAITAGVATVYVEYVVGI